MTPRRTLRGTKLHEARAIGRTSLLVLAAVLTLAACGGSAGSTPSAAVTPGGTDPLPTSPAPGSGGLPGAPLLVDEGLLRHLPDMVDSFPVEFSRESSESVAGDATLVENAVAIAYGIAADPASGDLVVAAVVQLRAGIFDDDWFRDWRDTYDEASCAQAGGLAGHAETLIDGRTVYIGTCSGGAHTYHVHLAEVDVVVSATAVGTRRFGEQLVDNLRG